jgi:hypothetical protein
MWWVVGRRAGLGAMAGVVWEEVFQMFGTFGDEKQEL